MSEATASLIAAARKGDLNAFRQLHALYIGRTHALCLRLLAEGWEVTGLDAMTPYYDVRLKERRHAMLAQNAAFRPVIGFVEEPGQMAALAEALRA